MIVPDVNLLVFAYNSDALDHERARTWWETSLSATQRVGLAWAVMLGYLQLMMQEHQCHDAMMLGMRTTITLDPDVTVRLERLTRERGISFKEAVNSTLRAGFEGRPSASDYRLPTYSMGVRPGIDLDRALQLDAAIEDEEVLRKLEVRK